MDDNKLRNTKVPWWQEPSPGVSSMKVHSSGGQRWSTHRRAAPLPFNIAAGTPVDPVCPTLLEDYTILDQLRSPTWVDLWPFSLSDLWPFLIYLETGAGVPTCLLSWLPCRREQLQKTDKSHWYRLIIRCNPVTEVTPPPAWRILNTCSGLMDKNKKAGGDLYLQLIYHFTFIKIKRKQKTWASIRQWNLFGK